MTAWQLFTMLNERDRPMGFAGIGPIPTLAALHLCEAYDATMEDFEKIMLLDSLFRKYENEKEKKKKEGKDSAAKAAKAVKPPSRTPPRPRARRR